MNKIVRDQIVESPSEYGLGKITANFSAEQYPGYELIDTTVRITIEPFGIAWKDRQKLVDELVKVVKKFQI